MQVRFLPPLPIFICSTTSSYHTQRREERSMRGYLGKLNTKRGGKREINMKIKIEEKTVVIIASSKVNDKGYPDCHIIPVNTGDIVSVIYYGFEEEKPKEEEKDE